MRGFVSSGRVRALAVLMTAAVVSLGALAAVNAGASGSGPVFWRCVPRGGGVFVDAKCSRSALEEHGRYEAEQGVTFEHEGFAASGGALELRAPESGFTLTCTRSEIVGRFLTSGMREAKLTLKGCKSGTEVCTSPGLPAKTIATGTLTGGLGWIDEAKFEAGLDFKPAAEGAPVAEFECYKAAEGFTAANLQLRGSAIGQLREDIHTFTKKFTLTFASGAGTEIRSFEGAPADVLALYRVSEASEEPIEPVQMALKGSSVLTLAVER